MEARPIAFLPDRAPAPEAPVMFALHFLGGSAAEWVPLIDRWSGRLSWVAIDLPGFGEARDDTGYSVAAMAAAVVDQVRKRAPREWVLIGHSMGARVACVVARLAEDGAEGLGGLSHIILLAGSPPAPEPMDEVKRQTMLSWFAGDVATSRAEADGFIQDNVGTPLNPEFHERAVADVLRMERAAWVAWLASGSREDWSARIGVLQTPALIIAGAEDGALGLEAQATLMAPHFASSHLRALPNVGHLLPLECPDALVLLMSSFLDGSIPREPAIDPAYRALIDSDRVSARTRRVLLKRAKAILPNVNILTEDETATLRAVTDRVIPQQGEARIDIAARILDALASGEGDGWRFADLPADAIALAAGIRTLNAAARAAYGSCFAALTGDKQDGLLARVAKTDLMVSAEASEGHFSPKQMTLWFEDLRSTATQIYVAHPATQGRLGYSGLANRGDGRGPQGFVEVGLGAREPWEPLATTVAPR